MCNFYLIYKSAMPEIVIFNKVLFNVLFICIAYKHV